MNFPLNSSAYSQGQKSPAGLESNFWAASTNVPKPCRLILNMSASLDQVPAGFRIHSLSFGDGIPT